MGLKAVGQTVVMSATTMILCAGAAAVPLGAAHVAMVRPVPFAAGHINAAELKDPPTTAICQALLGISCYRPSQLRAAYNLDGLYSHGLDGTGRTIVIVDSFGSPTIAHDLQVFDQTFGLPDPPSLETIAPAGAIPPFDASNPDMVGWAQETTLDVEWSHAIAPGARILVVATPVAETEGITGFPEMMAAENYVINHNLGDVISQSFGATEETFAHPKTDIAGLRSAFHNAARHHVTVLASSGDAGSTDALPDTSCCYPFAVNSWPSSDPLVTSIGGTQLHLDAAGNRLAPDQVWNDGFGAGGGGLSKVFGRPEFQDGVERVVGDARGTPDLSLSAAVDGGAIVYYSFIRPTSPWHIFGGTSESSPLFAGIVAIADQAAGHRLGNLNATLYELAGEHHNSGIVDIKIGDNSFTFCSAACGTPQKVNVTVPGFPATTGYDLSSGLGTVDGQALVRALAHTDDGHDTNNDH
jgi:subtilase family serine protease